MAVVNAAAKWANAAAAAPGTGSGTGSNGTGSGTGSRSGSGSGPVLPVNRGRLAAAAAAAVRQGGTAGQVGLAGQQVGPTAVGLQRGVRELIMMSVAMPHATNGTCPKTDSGPGSGGGGGGGDQVKDQKK